MKQAFLSGVAFASLAVFASCERSTTLPQDGAYQIDAAVAAIVNGEPVYTLDIELEAASQGLIERGEVLEPDDPVYDQILEQLIDQKLLAQEAIARGLQDEDVSRHRLQAARERILGNILVENLVADEVDESAIRKMYAEQTRLQELGEEVLVRHILLNTQEKANEILAELRNGKDFEKLAYDHSIDRETFLEGGRIGYVLPEELPLPFADAIRQTPVGALSNPFRSDLGWHIIKVDDRRKEEPATLEEMRPKVVKFLTLSEISEILKKLRARAEIEKDGVVIGHSDPFEELPTVEQPVVSPPTPAPEATSATETASVESETEPEPETQTQTDTTPEAPDNGLRVLETVPGE